MPTLNKVNLESYISGYVDGEGSFCVSMRPRKGNIVGWEAIASFSVSQNEDRSEVLDLIRHHFKCGFIRRNVSDKTLKYETRSLSDLITKIIPHFEIYPLQSGRQKDFEIFKKVCQKMSRGEHLKERGLVEIAELVSVMNPSGRRLYRKKAILNSLNKMKI